MHERAGTVALPQDLIDVDAVSAAYYDLVPDVDNPNQKVVFGTSGHRGSSLDAAFNEAHIVAITAAIVEYRAKQGYDGHLYIGRDTHLLSAPAWRTALEVLTAAGVDVEVEAGLVMQGNLGLAGGDETRRQRRIGRGHQLDIETMAGEGAALLGHHQRRVVGVDEPVEQHGQLVGGVGRARQGEKGGGEERFHESFHDRPFEREVRALRPRG